MIWLRAFLCIVLLAMQVTKVEGAMPEVGLPSLSTTDGRFLGLGGQGLQTLSAPSTYNIGLSRTETTLAVSIFDGDLGGLWDNHDPLNTVQTVFTLYADPGRTGDPNGKTALVSMTSAQMLDNAFKDLYRGPVHPAARAFSGNYFYLLEVKWSSPAQSANEFNAFKIRAEGQLGITPGDWAFVGAPINVGFDPAFGTASNSYNGSWDWFVYVPPGTTQVEFTECDADSAQTTPSGSPPDDDPNDARVRISPNIRHSVFGPDGRLLINTLVPSGNTVCQTKTASVTGGGTYRWNWIGVDAHNLIFMRLRYETLADSASLPLDVGTPPSVPTDTPTVTNTPTITSTPTNTPTGTRTPDPTFTPTPRPPDPTRPAGGGPPLPPTVLVPILTQRSLPEASPTNTPVVNTPMPTATPTVTSTSVPPTKAPTPRATVAAVVVRMLPRTGGEFEGLLGMIALSGVGIAAVGIAAIRRRRR